MDIPAALQAILRPVFRPPPMSLSATERYPAAWAAILSGAGLGVIWAIAARIWMRLISTTPEFSIAGTLAIVVIATLFGACAGFAFVARRRGWRRWGHYVPRGLTVAFFIPFGIGGGLPLMLSVLLATLAVTQPASTGVWVLAALAIIVGTAGDAPSGVAIGVPAGAAALTVWKWAARHRRDKPNLLRMDTWIDRIVRTVLLLLAAAGVGAVAWEIAADKPGWRAPAYILFYLILLYPLFLALRIGLEPHAPGQSQPDVLGGLQPSKRP